MLRLIMLLGGAALLAAAPHVVPKDVHKNKVHQTFESFYPFYLGEHRNPVCKTLHVIGTSIIILLSLASITDILPALIIAGCVGFFVMNLTMNLPHGFVELITMVLTYNVCMFLFTGHFGTWVLVPFVGYSFAWVGHFFFEKNKPATFTYAIFSLMGDFRMLYDTYRAMIMGS